MWVFLETNPQAFRWGDGEILLLKRGERQFKFKMLWVWEMRIHRIIESLRLERTLKLSNPTINPSPPCLLAMSHSATSTCFLNMSTTSRAICFKTEDLPSQENCTRRWHNRLEEGKFCWRGLRGRMRTEKHLSDPVLMLLLRGETDPGSPHPSAYLGHGKQVLQPQWNTEGSRERDWFNGRKDKAVQTNEYYCPGCHLSCSRAFLPDV